MKLKIVFIVLLFYACQEPHETNSHKYLALGDSYTIGESVDATDRFPIQLYSKLNSSGYNLDYPNIIAKTGWTTNDLLTELNSNEPLGDFSLVTLLIGVNNQYRGGNKNNYREEFKLLLDKAISYASDPKNVIVISIPDWGVTPFAENTGRDPNKIAKEINEFNVINKAVSDSSNINYIYITDISRKAENDLSLLAQDGLHPSGEMYSLWVDAMLDTVKNILDQYE